MAWSLETSFLRQRWLSVRSLNKTNYQRTSTLGAYVVSTPNIAVGDSMTFVQIYKTQLTFI